MLNLQPILDMVAEPGTKGLPASAGAIRLADIGRAGWRLHDDLQLPAAVLRRCALRNNAEWMRRFAERLGVALCPHGKTTMAPQLFARQLENGAWGLSCATIAHLRTYRRFGVRRIIYANQIVTPDAARWLARELAAETDFDVLVFVDSEFGATLLADAGREIGLNRPIRILIEIGAPGARTGVRGAPAALRLATFAASRPELALAGVAAFEGVVAGRTDREMEPLVAAMLDDIVAAAERIAEAGVFAADGEVILSAGGSRFFDMVAARLRDADVGRRPPLVVLRSGCYISHDAIQYELAFERLLQRTGGDGPPGRLENALEVWAEVQSRPEAGWLYATLGKRDISYDADLPRVIAARRRNGETIPVRPGELAVRRLSDQHAHIEVAGDAPFAIGDQLGFGVSHPCTTFDKWRILFEVDDDDVIVTAIATFF